MDLTWSTSLQVYLLPWNSPHKTWSHNWILIYIFWNEHVSLSTRLPVSWWRNFYLLRSWYTTVSQPDCLFLSLVLSWAGFMIATIHSAFKVAGMSKEKGKILRCKEERARGVNQHRSNRAGRDTLVTPWLKETQIAVPTMLKSQGSYSRFGITKARVLWEHELQASGTAKSVSSPCSKLGGHRFCCYSSETYFTLSHLQMKEWPVTVELNQESWGGIRSRLCCLPCRTLKLQLE